MTTDSESDEQEFLSPEAERRRPVKDQGASPTLRRSSRKRKSVSGQAGMSKGSSSKKKKASTTPPKSMPKVPRSPQGTQQQTGETPGPSDIGAMLKGMEERLAGRIEATNRVAKEAVALSRLTKDSLEALEEMVENNEEALKKALEETEERIMAKMNDKVETLVRHHLIEAGFDPSLTAGGLSTIDRGTATNASYAETTKGRRSSTGTSCTGASCAGGTLVKPASKEDRREDRFWTCRRSLRLWPVKRGEDGLKEFQKKNLD